MDVTIDREADALYVRVAPGGAVARTEEIDADTLADVDAEGALVGVEVLGLDRPWPVDEIVRRFGLDDATATELRALGAQRTAA